MKNRDISGPNFTFRIIHAILKGKPEMSSMLLANGVFAYQAKLDDVQSNGDCDRK